MKLVMIKVAFGVVVSFYISVHASLNAAPAPISADEIAGIMGYPADKLVIQDVTDEVNHRAAMKGRGPVISSHTISGEGNTFARLSIDITAAGVLLTPKLVQEVEQSIANSKGRGVQSPLQWLTLGDFGHGVAGLGIIGPGGSQDRIIITMPKQGRDIQITATVPADPPLQVLIGAESYHDAIMTGQIRQRLTDCLNTLAVKTAGQPVKAVITDAPPHTPLPNSDSVPASRSERPSTQARSEPQPVLQKTAAAEPAANSQNQLTPTRKTLWWSVGGLLVLALVLWRVMHRRQ
jgi:hypothetical protein